MRPGRRPPAEPPTAARPDSTQVAPGTPLGGHPRSGSMAAATHNERRRAQGPWEGNDDGGHLHVGRRTGRPGHQGARGGADRRRDGPGAHAHAGRTGAFGDGRAPARPRRPAGDDPLRRGHGGVRLRHRTELGRQRRDAAARRAGHHGVQPLHPRDTSRPRPRWPSAPRRCTAFLRRSPDPCPPSAVGPAPALSRGGRCGRATVQGRRPRPGSADRARRTTAGPARPHRRARPPH